MRKSPTAIRWLDVVTRKHPDALPFISYYEEAGLLVLTERRGPEYRRA